MRGNIVEPSRSVRREYFQRGRAASRRKKRASPSTIILIEDNSARAKRRVLAGVTPRRSISDITIRIHRIKNGRPTVIAERSYSVGKLPADARANGKAALALELLDSLRLHRSRNVIVAGSAYGCNKQFLDGLVSRGYDFTVELRASTVVQLDKKMIRTPISGLFKNARWKKIHIAVPHTSTRIPYLIAGHREARLHHSGPMRIFSAATGGIKGPHRGTIFGLTSIGSISVARLVLFIGWARWIRLAVRRQERSVLEKRAMDGTVRGERNASKSGIDLLARANITQSRRQDETAARDRSGQSPNQFYSRGVFASLPRLNVVELFAGAGGMGLGFVLASHKSRQFNLTYSAEVNPIYVETLKLNHRTLRNLKKGNENVVPETTQPIDLRRAASFKEIAARVKETKGVHILIGGPPCQGFSNANRNSWHSTNPHNRLVEVFIQYVESLRPKVFLMENVQGILWTSRNTSAKAQPYVLEHLAQRFASAGYVLFPKLLDAVWYGAPQHRNRFFLLGLRKDLGYRPEDFGAWGPFPLPTHGPGATLPYVTIKDAIGDLPVIGNGESRSTMPYKDPSSDVLRKNSFLRSLREGAARGVISEHITSRHADYVIERYRRIPAGGNWENIAHLLTNYSEKERTHSNIYRRLSWREPSITIGHYRKSMLVHPSQHRGLSLREASRLQSFPDWFRFAGAQNGREGGLVHKQQQLANAVCPLVTKAIAEFILEL